MAKYVIFKRAEGEDDFNYVSLAELNPKELEEYKDQSWSRNVEPPLILSVKEIKKILKRPVRKLKDLI